MKALRTPLLAFALPALALAACPAAAPGLRLDRAALGAGEAWRLWTGHWVHFSASHLGWNLLVLLAAGTWLEHRHPGRLARHALLAPPLISGLVLAAEPTLRAYGGLSALATGTTVLLALAELRTPDTPRALWAAVLAVVMLKAGADLLHLGPGFARFADPSVRPSATAHLAGAGAALLQHLLPGLRARTAAPTGRPVATGL